MREVQTCVRHFPQVPVFRISFQSFVWHESIRSCWDSSRQLGDTTSAGHPLPAIEAATAATNGPESPQASLVGWGGTVVPHAGRAVAPLRGNRRAWSVDEERAVQLGHRLGIEENASDDCAASACLHRECGIPMPSLRLA